MKKKYWFFPIAILVLTLIFVLILLNKDDILIHIKNNIPSNIAVEEKPLSDIRIFLAGDSTVESYDSHYYPLAGWGQVIDRFFNESVIIRNHAISGYSSKSFADEGKLDAILKEIQPGDYLFIQFGHNDQKSKQPDLYAAPYSTYKEYLTKYVEGAIEKEAIPILITPVNRRTFESNEEIVANSLAPYPDAMMELGQELEVPVIDLNTKSKVLFETLGFEKTKTDIFLWIDAGVSAKYPKGAQDDSHFRENGAIEIAKLIIEGIKEVTVEDLVKRLVESE